MIVFGLLIPLIFSSLRKLPLVVFPLFWGGVYNLLRITPLNRYPYFGAENTVRTFIELLFVVLSGLLGILLVRFLYRQFSADKEHDFSQDTYGTTEAIEQEQLRDEFRRSKQSERPIALIALEPTADDLSSSSARIPADLPLKEKQKLIYKTIKEVLAKQSRQSDLVLGRTNEGQFLIICPETNQVGANRLVKRISATTQDQLGIKIKFGISLYPDDSSTYEELQQIAETRLDNPQILESTAGK